MSYLGNLNPYMTQSNYAEEMRKRNQLLTGQKPAPQMSMNPVAPESQPDMSPNTKLSRQEQLANMIRKSNQDMTADDNALDYQRDYARGLLATKDAGPRQLGNVVVNNPWEGLSVGISRALGGYMMGKAAEKDEAMQPGRDAQQDALISIKAGDREYSREQDAAANRSRDLRDAATFVTAEAAASSAKSKTPGGTESERHAYVLGNPEEFTDTELAFAASRLGTPRIGTAADGSQVRIPATNIEEVFPTAYNRLQSNSQANQGAIAVEGDSSAGKLLKPTYQTPDAVPGTTAAEREKTDLANSLSDEHITSLFQYSPSYFEEGANQFPYPLNRAATSEAYRDFNAARSLTVSILGRMLSGAEVKDSEIERTTETFIPQAGDSNEMRARKEKRLRDFLAVYAKSGNEGIKLLVGPDIERYRKKYSGGNP